MLNGCRPKLGGKITTMKWLFAFWACLASGMIAMALHQEVNLIRRHQGGANGLIWLVAMIVSAVGSIIVAAFTWWIAGGQQAFYVAASAAVCLGAIGIYSVRRFNSEIRKALASPQYSAR
jgi:hypothetical protein